MQLPSADIDDKTTKRGLISAEIIDARPAVTTPKLAPKNKAGANMPPTKPIRIQIVVKNNFKNRKIIAEVNSTLLFNKSFIVSEPIPVTSGNLIATIPQIRPA